MGREVAQRVGIRAEVSAPVGSVGFEWLRLDRDNIRYKYDHSILPYEGDGSAWQGETIAPGHRISIMVRVSVFLWLPPVTQPN